MTFNHVLVPIRGDSSDAQAIELAASVVGPSRVHLSLIFVVEVAPEFPLEAELPREIDLAENALAAASNYAVSIFGANEPAISAELLQARAAGPAIVDEAALQHVEVIVMALKNQRKHGRPTVGETVPYVLKNAPCEVIIRRQPASSRFDQCDWDPDIEHST